jgi:hypothetical protein
VPPLLEAELDRLLALVDAGVSAQDARETRHQIIAAARIVYDLRLRHLPQTEIDQVRFDLWLAQVQVDAAAGEAGPVKGDASTLELVVNRFAHAVDASLAEALASGLAELRAAADGEDFEAAAAAAGEMRAAMAGRGWR